MTRQICLLSKPPVPKAGGRGLLVQITQVAVKNQYLPITLSLHQQLTSHTEGGSLKMDIGEQGRAYIQVQGTKLISSAFLVGPLVFNMSSPAVAMPLIQHMQLS